MTTGVNPKVRGRSISPMQSSVASSSSSKLSLFDRARSISPHARSILQRTFSRSRSHSRSRVGDGDDDVSVGSTGSSSSYGSSNHRQALLVAVTSCRSDAYHAHKAPGATSMLPRKAPSALKSFHELAVGVKDAYEALGATPNNLDPTSPEYQNMSLEERNGRTILWEFMKNLDFLLSLVDEVATDSVTRGVLKDDSAFKCLRDVIKKCNKILELMLIRRERKYTLFFRIVQPFDLKDLMKMKSWNVKVESALSGIGQESKKSSVDDESDTDSESVMSIGTANSNSSSSSNLFQRGRTLLPSAGRIRARRATPTPDMRHKNLTGADPTKSSADDGFSTFNAPLSSFNLPKTQKTSDTDDSQMNIPNKFVQTKPAKSTQTSVSTGMTPRAELVDVIIGLRHEKLANNKDSSNNAQPGNIKGNWLPKADIPPTVPKLPVEYIHRHRLMKQVVNSLIGRSDTDSQKDCDSSSFQDVNITCVTSRHADKPGNGKTTLAVAAIQTVEVREHFPDGIIWIQLGRKVLFEKDIRRLYEELYDQLLSNDTTFSKEEEEQIFARRSKSQPVKLVMNSDRDMNGHAANDSKFKQQMSHRKRFLCGDLEEVREDFLQIISQRRVLVCLDDVWRVEDLRWFVRDSAHRFQNGTDNMDNNNEHNMYLRYHYLITTRISGLLGPSRSTEIFVRIFSEQEAVKLFLLSAGKRVPVGKNSPVFNQVRMIVKGCGNAPLTLRLAGAMLRMRDRNWTLTSPTALALLEQSRLCLEEAARIRSFTNSLGRVIDLTFIMISDIYMRMVLRRCFVSFAMVFSECDWVLAGRGIPRDVILLLFNATISSTIRSDRDVSLSSEIVLDTLEHLNLLQRANHGVNMAKVHEVQDIENETIVKEAKSLVNGSLDGDDCEIVQNAKKNDGAASILDPAENISYLINGSIFYVAELMSNRKSHSFAPKSDEFTAMTSQIESEYKRMNKGTQPQWFEHATKYILTGHNMDNATVKAEKFHELLISSLLGIDRSLSASLIPNTINECARELLNRQGGHQIEKYLLNFLPTHLVKARMLPSARVVLTNSDFINRRIITLGPVEATRKLMSDINDVRLELQRTEDVTQFNGNTSDAIDDGCRESHDHLIYAGSDGSGSTSMDVHSMYREAADLILYEIERVNDVESNSEDLLNLAICLSTIGSGFMKARLWKDSMQRWEEANAIFRGLFGPNHIDVARSINAVGRAFIKLGEIRGALNKFMEAARIFEACGLSNHYDSLLNTQMIATLLIAIGEMEQADSRFFEIINAKKKLYGSYSLHVAKTVYEAGLAFGKHGQNESALRYYEHARSILDLCFGQRISPSLDLELHKASFDISLVELNIASIKAKKNNYVDAISSYDKAVDYITDLLRSDKDPHRIANQKRHLVFAMGRIGSLKMKMRDNAGALLAYQSLIQTVDSSSPDSSVKEKAKAHVKCATLYRQIGTKADNASSIVHLKEALVMYTAIYGASHKDTVAISTSLQQWKAQDAANEK